MSLQANDSDTRVTPSTSDPMSRSARRMTTACAAPSCRGGSQRAGEGKKLHHSYHLYGSPAQKTRIRSKFPGNSVHSPDLRHVEQIKAAAVGRDDHDLVTLLNLQVRDLDGRKVPSEYVPLRATILRNVDAEVGAHVERVRIAGIF